MIITVIMLLIVQVLMLLVLGKYCNPIEEDLKVLIVNKLRSVYAKAEIKRNDPQLQM